MSLVVRVVAELERRRAINPRFSLRAFARTVGLSHSALSRLRRGGTRPSDRSLERMASALGLAPAHVDAAVRSMTLDRLCVLTAHEGFRADARWIAVRLGRSLDDVQLALHEGLRRGRLQMTSRAEWRAQEVPWEIQ